MNEKVISHDILLQAEGISAEWNSVAFIYTLPDSDKPELIRVNAWSHYKHEENAHIIAAVDGHGWEFKDMEYRFHFEVLKHQE